jgi:NAD(P)-dependent dehydrogenase (short-subunit alcohol dehydrogenase family)
VSPAAISSSEPGLVWVAGVGAAGGLGARLAFRFAREGLLAVLTGRSGERLQKVAEELGAQGLQARALAGDVSRPEDVERLANQLAALGPLRAAIFNAGEAERGGILSLSAAQFEHSWRTGALAGFLFGQAAARALLANGLDAAHPSGRGSLLFTGATASLRGRPPFAAFAAAKAALRSLAQSLARELGPQGIHVAHVVIDGGIDGPRLRGAAPQRAENAGVDGLLNADAIAQAYWQLHVQHRSAWTQELDLRPFKEAF